MIAWKNVGNKQFIYLANRVYPEDSIRLYNSHLDATQRLHGHLILDLTQDANDGLRYRPNIFPRELKSVVYSDIGVEACETHLSRLSVVQDIRTEIA